MNRSPKLWEILAALLPIICGVTFWLWNLSTKVETQGVRLDNLEKQQTEYRADVKEIKDVMNQIRLELKDKANR